MHCKFLTTVRVIQVFLLVASLFNASAFAKLQTFNVEVVHRFGASRITKNWQPILERISQISDIHLRLVTNPGISAFGKQFEARKFDFAYMAPYHLIVANKKRQCLPLARDIGRNLFGIIVIKKNSPLKSVKGLNDKNTTSDYSLLRDMGLAGFYIKQ